jgi:outer membrane receptor protein involved in Fe transport
VGLGCAVLLVGFPLFSQVNTGRILGTVTDQSGGVIAGSTVAVTNVQTGVARNLTTDGAGEYVAPNLIPGTYAVRVTANGFQTFERQNILLELGKDARIDVQLTPGQITQTIEVTAAAPLLDTTSATIAGTLNSATITDLPMNGRNYLNLLVLRPGMVIRPGGGTLTQSTNGLRPEDNNYFIEGLDNDEPFTGQSIVNSTLPSGDAATILPIDAIQEVNVETNVPAEFGRRPGAVINIGIKSGTNTIHGTAYAFGRDSSWDATDFNALYPNPRPPAPTAALEQWGGTVGGPIVKNKLFYFGGFERLSYTVGSSFTPDIPTTAPNAGVAVSIPDATAALAASCATTPAQAFCGPGGTFTPNALSQKLLPLFPSNNTNISTVALGFPNVVGINNAVGKIDYHISDHHTIAGSYFFGNGNSIAEGSTVIQPYFRDLGQLRAEFVTTSWTWTPNSSWVNAVRVGWNHHHRVVNAADHLSTPNSYGINTGVTNPILGGLPVIDVGGFTQIGADGNLPKGYGPTSDYDLVDQASYLRGKHAFKFGGEILTFRANYGAFGTGRGRFHFRKDDLFLGSTPLEAFLAGVPNGKDGGDLLVGNAARLLTKWEYSGFFEDAWRIKSNVTVNLGLRYEYFTPLAETHNLIGNWEPQVGLEQVGVNIKSAYNGYHKDISPRIGVAWDIGGKGTTVVRLGGGIYFIDIINSAMMATIALPGRPPGITAIPTAFTLVLPDGTQQQPVNPTNGIGSAAVTFPGPALDWTSAGPVFPAASAGSGSAFQCGNGLRPGPGLPRNPKPCNILAVNRNLAQPYVESWNLGIQHSLTRNLSLEVNYIGNHGGRLPGVVDLNQIDPQSPAELACGNCESITNRPYYAAGATHPGYPYLQGINLLTNLDISNYNALQATLTGRSYHGLSFLVGYTYSHAIDENSANYNQSLPQNSLQPKLEYGNSDNDLRHHVAISLTYNIPGKKSWGQVLEGWAVNSAVALQSGLPWSPIDGNSDISKTNEQQDHWDFFGNPKDFKSGANSIPFYDGVSAPFPAACQGHPGTDLSLGCYAQGNSALVAPLAPAFGTAGRNIFRDSGFRDWDFSLFKNWKVKERLTAQFRAEFFNILNHAIFANPTVPGNNDPSVGPSGGVFGCGCVSPDQAATNPILGTGGARAIQLGLKLIF